MTGSSVGACIGNWQPSPLIRILNSRSLLRFGQCTVTSSSCRQPQCMCKHSFSCSFFKLSAVTALVLVVWHLWFDGVWYELLPAEFGSHFEPLLYYLVLPGRSCSCYVLEYFSHSTAVFLCFLWRQLSLWYFEPFDRVHGQSSVEQQQEPVYISYVTYHFPWHHPQRRFAHEQLDKQLPSPSMMLLEVLLAASEVSGLKDKDILVTGCTFHFSNPHASM